MNLGEHLRRIGYRAYQFTRGLRPTLAPSEIEIVRASLTAAELELFLAADPRDRRHSVDLFVLLSEAGAEGAAAGDDLLCAALLHDVGKGPLRVWDRILFVILNAAVPTLARRCETPSNPDGGARWRDALWRLRHHAERTAAMLEGAGTPPRVIEIVRRHTGPIPVDDHEVAAFIRADDRV